MSSATPTSTLTPAGFQVLLAVASGYAHGYAVMGFIEEVTEGAVQLSPGTLYRTIARLVSDGLVKEAPDDSDPEAPHDARRRYYALTERGWEAACAEARLLLQLADAAAAAGLMPEDAVRMDPRSQP